MAHPERVRRVVRGVVEHRAFIARAAIILLLLTPLWGGSAPSAVAAPVAPAVHVADSSQGGVWTGTINIKWDEVPLEDADRRAHVPVSDQEVTTTALQDSQVAYHTSYHFFSTEDLSSCVDTIVDNADQDGLVSAPLALTFGGGGWSIFPADKESYFIRTFLRETGTCDPGSTQELDSIAPPILTGLPGAADTTHLVGNRIEQGPWPTCEISGGRVCGTVQMTESWDLTLVPAVRPTPGLSISPPTVSFPAGQPGAPQSQTLTLDVEGDSVRVTGLTVTGPGADAFTPEGGCTGIVLQAPTACFINVTYKPALPVGSSATLNVAYEVFNSMTGDASTPAASPLRVSLAGEGCGSGVGLKPFDQKFPLYEFPPVVTLETIVQASVEWGANGTACPSAPMVITPGHDPSIEISEPGGKVEVGLDGKLSVSAPSSPTTETKVTVQSVPRAASAHVRAADATPAPLAVVTDLGTVLSPEFVQASTITTLTVDATAVASGSTIHVQGSGFSPNLAALVLLASVSSPDAQATTRVVADGSGNITGSIQVPTTTAGGHWVIVAVDLNEMDIALRQFTQTYGRPGFVLAANEVTVEVPCGPRPSVNVAAGPGQSGVLVATIKAGQSVGTPGNALKSLKFGPATNATVAVNGQQGPGNFTVNLPANTTQATLQVTRTTPGQAVTVPLTVVDGCGEWPTFVGGGPNAF